MAQCSNHWRRTTSQPFFRCFLLHSSVLFILKHRQSSGGYGYNSFSSGLHNSARFVNEMLNANGIESHLVIVRDNNDIDREVTKYKPTHVIVEALWVVPEKFAVLQKLHPSVKWIVRGHSEIPFLANEGIAVEWIKEYVTYKNVYVASNSPSSVNDIKKIIFAVDPVLQSKVIYLPNWYPVPENLCLTKTDKKDSINIGCFGAIRPLKNQLIQALAAVDYGRQSGQEVIFHINGTRREQYGDTVLKNIRALFQGTKYKLVEHPWMTHGGFLKVLKQMDVSMCVSFSESFCIVAADTVISGVPLVCSKEVNWSSPQSQVFPTSSDDITKAIFAVTGNKKNSILSANFLSLKSFINKSQGIWLRYLRS